MKRSFFLPIIALFIFSFTSCKKDIPADATIRYYLTTTESDVMDSIEVNFIYARAMQRLPKDNSAAIITIYLNQKDYFLRTNYVKGVKYINHIGESAIETSEIEWFDLSFGATALIYKNGQSRKVVLETPEVTPIKEELTVYSYANTSVIFELDMEVSRFEIQDGTEKFFPVFKVLINEI